MKVSELAPATARPADPGQLAQVLRNLLENAVRYGREGGTVRLSVRALAAPEGGLAPGVLLAVADDGPGHGREHVRVNLRGPREKEPPEVGHGGQVERIGHVVRGR